MYPWARQFPHYERKGIQVWSQTGDTAATMTQASFAFGSNASTSLVSFPISGSRRQCMSRFGCSFLVTTDANVARIPDVQDIPETPMRGSVCSCENVRSRQRLIQSPGGAFVTYASGAAPSLDQSEEIGDSVCFLFFLEERRCDHVQLL